MRAVSSPPLETTGSQIRRSHIVFVRVRSTDFRAKERLLAESTVSIILFGNETQSLLLLLLVAEELYFNRSFYADREIFKQTTASDPELKAKLVIYHL